jgi:predicted tellurium resistance membrane protein TerC
MTLIADGFGYHIPRGFIYSAIGFSLVVEGLNHWVRRNRQKEREAAATKRGAE